MELPKTLDELGYWIIDTVNKNYKKNKLIGLVWDVTYKDSVSNTHSAPVNGFENFSCKPELPRGYPGFQGRVWYRMENEKEFSWKPLAPSMTHTGTGGGGSYDCPVWNEYCSCHYFYDNTTPLKPYVYSYDYRFYLMDFPDIEKQVLDEIHAQRVMAKLTNSRVIGIHHKFSWLDEKVMLQDQKLIKEWKSTQKEA